MILQLTKLGLFYWTYSDCQYLFYYCHLWIFKFMRCIDPWNLALPLHAASTSIACKLSVLESWLHPWSSLDFHTLQSLSNYYPVSKLVKCCWSNRTLLGYCRLCFQDVRRPGFDTTELVGGGRSGGTDWRLWWACALPGRLRCSGSAGCEFGDGTWLWIRSSDLTVWLFESSESSLNWQILPLHRDR